MELKSINNGQNIDQKSSTNGAPHRLLATITGVPDRIGCDENRGTRPALFLLVLGTFLAASWGALGGVLEASWRGLGGFLASLGSALGASWGRLGPSWNVVGGSWRRHGAS